MIRTFYMPLGAKASPQERMVNPEAVQSRVNLVATRRTDAERDLNDMLNAGYTIKAQSQMEYADETGVTFVLHLQEPPRTDAMQIKLKPLARQLLHVDAQYAAVEQQYAETERLRDVLRDTKTYERDVAALDKADTALDEARYEASAAARALANQLRDLLKEMGVTAD